MSTMDYDGLKRDLSTAPRVPTPEQAKTTTIWVCGRVEEDGWHVLGIYDFEEGAVARAAKLKDFVGSCELNKDLPGEEEFWPNAYFPLNPKENPTDD